MDLTGAIEKHVAWKMKLLTAILNKATMDAETISKADCCELGKWLHGEARLKYNNLASYPACVVKHAAFHAEASKVAKVINEKNYIKAEIMVGADSAFAAASLDVCIAIMQLKDQAGL